MEEKVTKTQQDKEKEKESTPSSTTVNSNEKSEQKNTTASEVKNPDAVVPVKPVMQQVTEPSTTAASEVAGTTTTSSSSNSSVTTTSSSAASVRRTPSPPKRSFGSLSSVVTPMDTIVSETENRSSDKIDPVVSLQKIETKTTTEKHNNLSSAVGEELPAKKESENTPNTESGKDLTLHSVGSSSVTTKRSAPDSQSEVPSLEGAENDSSGGGDPKRRKIKRDFKLETRSSTHSTTASDTSTSNTYPHRVSYSTAGRSAKPVTNTSSISKPGMVKPVTATVPSKPSTSSDKNVKGDSSTPASPASSQGSSGSGSDKNVPGKSAEQLEVASSSANNTGDSIEKEKPEAGAASGPKVPPIKIVFGATTGAGVSENSENSGNGSSTGSGNSPTASFPYVVSSTSPTGGSANTNETTPPVTSSSASSIPTPIAQSSKPEVKKEPVAKVKLVATIGPTGGTLTYSSSTSTTASTTILTTTSISTVASHANSSTKEEASSVATAESVRSPNNTNNASIASNASATTVATTTAARSPTTVTSTISSSSASSDSPKPGPEPMEVETSSTDAGNDDMSNVVHEPSSMKDEPELVEESASISNNACTVNVVKIDEKSSPTPPSSSSVTATNEKEEEKEASKEKEPSSRSSPPTVSSTTVANASTVALTSVPSTNTTGSTTSSSGASSGVSEPVVKEKHQRITRSSHRKAEANSTAGNGQQPSSPATNSPKNSACSSPAQPEAQPSTETLTKVAEEKEKTDSTDSAHTELHPRKRKLKKESKDKDKEKETKEATASGASSSNSSTTGDPNEGTQAETKPQSEPQPVLNCFEMYLNIRKQIEARRRNLFPVQPKPPQGFKDYLMNRASYVLAGNANARLAVPLLTSPANLQIQMKETFIEQEKERHKLRLQHLVEKEKLVLSVEQEILRVHGRAARALSNQALPYSVCTILKDEEVYNLLTPEQEEKEKNARSRYNGRLFLSWLQDIDDKWDKVKESMLLRHHNEAESLHAVQKMNWEWKLREFGLCEPRATPVMDDLHVPMVHVSDDFDLLPA